MPPPPPDGVGASVVGRRSAARGVVALAPAIPPASAVVDAGAIERARRAWPGRGRRRRSGPQASCSFFTAKAARATTTTRTKSFFMGGSLGAGQPGSSPVSPGAGPNGPPGSRSAPEPRRPACRCRPRSWRPGPGQRRHDGQAQPGAAGVSAPGRSARTKRSKVTGSIDAGKPGPSSATISTQAPASSLTLTSTRTGVAPGVDQQVDQDLVDPVGIGPGVTRPGHLDGWARRRRASGPPARRPAHRSTDLGRSCSSPERTRASASRSSASRPRRMASSSALLQARPSTSTSSSGGPGPARARRAGSRWACAARGWRRR